ncbi:response regulator transcription factor [Pararhodospirillum oryzae]|uniref:DNA-binding response regulator n=1 Tax=Pararhodospirillum oryzae TaxID=478448 RepID=A0A512HA88_9PROT|nr:response regulator transcription factor [Pararhodospirillum oryzae]GEO82348.1 DNA-binding response regulator [Pararhodospirillum oryzae]
MAKILIIDDEPQIRRFLSISLGANGHEVVESDSGQDGIATALRESPDLVILDLGLPDRDGQDVITALRASGPVPIIVLSVRSGERDKVEALDRGADDYVTKPFGIAELMARIRAALRPRPGTGVRAPGPLVVGGLCIDPEHRRVTRDGVPVPLSRKEYALLSLLARHADHVLTHAELLRTVWGEAHVHDTAYLRVYIKQLRQKLEPDPALPTLILTELGVGYRLRTLSGDAG